MWFEINSSGTSKLMFITVPLSSLTNFLLHGSFYNLKVWLTMLQLKALDHPATSSWVWFMEVWPINTASSLSLVSPYDEAEFWGWLEVWRPALLCFTVNQRPHWACLTVWSLWRNPGMDRYQRKSNLSCWIHQAAQSTLLASSSGIRWWVSTV